MHYELCIRLDFAPNLFDTHAAGSKIAVGIIDKEGRQLTYIILQEHLVLSGRWVKHCGPGKVGSRFAPSILVAVGAYVVDVDASSLVEFGKLAVDFRSCAITHECESHYHRFSFPYHV